MPTRFGWTVALVAGTALVASSNVALSKNISGVKQTTGHVQTHISPMSAASKSQGTHHNHAARHNTRQASAATGKGHQQCGGSAIGVGGGASPNPPTSGKIATPHAGPAGASHC